LQKGDFVLKAGQVCKQYYFIESGSVRLYYHQGEDDFTVWIGASGQIFTDLESYLNEISSRLNFEAIEKSKVLQLAKLTATNLHLIIMPIIHYSDELLKYLL
jgi:CRP-like cAMP-binding protein